MNSLTNADALASLENNVIARGIILVGNTLVHAHVVSFATQLIRNDRSRSRPTVHPLDGASLWGLLRTGGTDLFITESDPVFGSLVDIEYRDGGEELAQIYSFTISYEQYQNFIALTGPYPTPGIDYDPEYGRTEHQRHNWTEEGF